METDEFYQKLDSLYETGNIAAVEAFLAKVADESALCCGKSSELNIVCLNEQGSLYRALSNFARSIDCFEVALDLITVQFGDRSPEYATTLNNLAGTYRQTGNFSKAKENFTRSKDILCERNMTDSYLYASTLNNLALLQIDTKEFESAYENMKESVAILEHIPGTEIEIATSFANISALLELMGDNKLAIQYIGKSLEILVNHPANPHYVTALNQQANLNYQEKNLKEALAGFQSVKDHIANTFGKNLEYAMVCNNLSRTYDRLADQQNAIAAASEAYATYKAVLGEGNPKTAQALAWLDKVGS